MTKKELSKLRTRLRALKGSWRYIADYAGVSYMTVYRMKEGLWESFKDSTYTAILVAVARVDGKGA